MNKTKEYALELKAKISNYDQLYYENGISEISDAEYDRLYQEYVDLEQLFPELKDFEDSPTNKVGAGKDSGSSTLKKFTHKSPLLSIDKKSQNVDDLKEFYEKCGGDGTVVVIEPKLDGITCNVNYENGILVNAATRGNGYIGDLITENFKNTETKFPMEIEKGASLELRGEAIIPYDYFRRELINEYSNPRNAVAGIMRQIDADEVKNKGIKVMFYDYGIVSDSILEMISNSSDSDFNRVNHLKELGFQDNFVLKANNWNNLKLIVESKMNNHIQNIDGFNVLVHNDFPQAVCDGLVIKVDSIKLREEIGFSEKGPKWAFAFKFKSLQAETTITKVEWQVGKSGRVVPVGVFEEISLGGTKITKSTLNNFEYMSNLPTIDSAGNINLNKTLNLKALDTIIVERANDVIPRIVAIKSRAGGMFHPQDMRTTNLLYENELTFSEPSNCPVCSNTLRKEGPLHFCDNPLCEAQLKGKIEHFTSRDAMNIVGLGEAIVNELFNLNYLNSVSDIYNLHIYAKEMEKIERFGKKKISNLLKSIENSKTPELWQFIYALSIPNVGKRASKDIAARYHTLDNFLKAKKEELLEIEDFGEIMSENIYKYINNKSMLEMISNLLNYGVSPKPVIISNDKLKGLSFVITGTLVNPRNYYQEIIESNGGKVSGSVSKKTSAVLIGTDAGSKEVKARQFANDGVNILILDNEELIKNYFNSHQINI